MRWKLPQGVMSMAGGARGSAWGIFSLGKADDRAGSRSFCAPARPGRRAELQTVFLVATLICLFRTRVGAETNRASDYGLDLFLKAGRLDRRSQQPGGRAICHRQGRCFECRRGRRARAFARLSRGRRWDDISADAVATGPGRRPDAR